MKDALKLLHDRLEGLANVSAAEREELLGLIDEVEAEIGSAEEEPVEELRESIQVAADLAVAEPGNQGLLSRLEDLVLRIEAAHPRAAAAIGKLGYVLDRMGI